MNVRKQEMRFEKVIKTMLGSCQILSMDPMEL